MRSLVATTDVDDKTITQALNTDTTSHELLSECSENSTSSDVDLLNVSTPRISHQDTPIQTKRRLERTRIDSIDIFRPSGRDDIARNAQLAPSTSQCLITRNAVSEVPLTSLIDEASDASGPHKHALRITSASVALEPRCMDRRSLHAHRSRITAKRDLQIGVSGVWERPSLKDKSGQFVQTATATRSISTSGTQPLRSTGVDAMHTIKNLSPEPRSTAVGPQASQVIEMASHGKLHLNDASQNSLASTSLTDHRPTINPNSSKEISAPQISRIKERTRPQTDMPMRHTKSNGKLKSAVSASRSAKHDKSAAAFKATEDIDTQAFGRLDRRPGITLTSRMSGAESGLDAPCTPSHAYGRCSAAETDTRRSDTIKTKSKQTYLRYASGNVQEHAAPRASRLPEARFSKQKNRETRITNPTRSAQSKEIAGSEESACQDGICGFASTDP